jgi:hypothetical protein
MIAGRACAGCRRAAGGVRRMSRRVMRPGCVRRGWSPAPRAVPHRVVQHGDECAGEQQLEKDHRGQRDGRAGQPPHRVLPWWTGRLCWVRHRRLPPEDRCVGHVQSRDGAAAVPLVRWAESTTIPSMWRRPLRALACSQARGWQDDSGSRNLGDSRAAIRTPQDVRLMQVPGRPPAAGVSGSLSSQPDPFG